MFSLFKRHGMDSMDPMDSMSSMGDNSTMSSGMMIFLHGGLGDTLWFEGWTPLTAGATFGACVGLLFLATFSRFLAAIRRSADCAWRQAALDRHTPAFSSVPSPGLSQKASMSTDNEIAQLSLPPSSLARPRLNEAPPFIAAYDLPRGAVQIVQSFCGYLLMLAVMTFKCVERISASHCSAWYLIAVLLGIGIGETLFGRYGLHGADMGH